ncbi:hypothetical protein OBBRIDRAFT_636623 [Obba rivulosa]|uniref:Uncharacterized protein n=1 Tax=Obba rivulosa TaxID=1052685 RepID=A0A8E2DKC8_9APHY|nr:hypothetical protein OBBRIDRAFT_636623 [Obba rivulosa]
MFPMPKSIQSVSLATDVIESGSCFFLAGFLAFCWQTIRAKTSSENSVCGSTTETVIAMKWCLTKHCDLRNTAIMLLFMMTYTRS